MVEMIDMIDDEPRQICKCGHAIGHCLDSTIMMHLRKGCEYSVTCWECDCRKAEINEG
jgi:hypothetical protein